MDERPKEDIATPEIKLSAGNRKKANMDNCLHSNTTKDEVVRLSVLQTYEKPTQKDLSEASNTDSCNNAAAEILHPQISTQVEENQVITSAVKSETPPVAEQTVYTIPEISVSRKKNCMIKGRLVFVAILIGLALILGATVYGRTSIQIAGNLLVGSYVEALQKVNTLPEDGLGTMLHGIWIDALAERIEGMRPKTVNELLAMAQIEKLAEDITDFKSPGFNNALNIYSGIQSDPIWYHYEVDLKSLDQLYSMCGTKGCGKILVIQEYHNYPNHETVYEIPIWSMKYIPLEYFPTSVDEVDYVVVLSYDFKEYEDGFYLSETVPLQEYATIYIYSVRDSANIWTSSVIEGPPPGSFSYINEPPEYHSGGSPDVEAAFIEAMKVIMK